MKKFFLILCLFLTLTTVTSSVYADDIDKIMEALTKIEEYTSGTEAYSKAIDDLDADQFKLLADHFGYGDLLNDDTAQNDRKWSPDSWDDALKGLSGGNEGRYKELVDEYQENHPYLSSDDMKKGASDAYATNYEQQVETNRAAMSHASYSFEDVNKHLDNIKELSGKINQAENQKAIEEINARINAEVAYLQVEQIKSMSVLNEQIAQQQASSLVHEKAASEFNQIPDK